MSSKSAVECSITHKVDINLPNKFVPQLGEREQSVPRGVESRHSKLKSKVCTMFKLVY
jgi:hypothetical protein